MSIPPDYSNYPRANYPRPNAALHPSGIPYRRPGVHFDVIGDAWFLFRREWPTWVAATLIYGFTAVVIQAPATVLSNFIQYGAIWPPLGAKVDWARYVITFPISLVAGAVIQAFNAGLILMGIRQIRGEPINAADIFKALGSLPVLFIGGLLYNVIVTLGFVCLILPGIYLVGALSLTMAIIADQQVSGLTAIKLGFEKMGSVGNALMMVLLLFVVGLIGIPVTCMTCGIGLLVLFPISSLILATEYVCFFPTPDPMQGMPAPPTNWPASPGV
jgi:uncharacterized membrane protein